MTSPVRPPPLSSASGRPKNRLLARLPDDDFRRIQPLLTTIPTTIRQRFHSTESAFVTFTSGPEVLDRLPRRCRTAEPSRSPRSGMKAWSG